MPTETKKKDNSFLYLISTIGFIVVGIILTGIINTTKSSTDIRSRASKASGIEATAIISQVDSTKNVVTVDQLIFTSSPQKNMGSWTVTPPPSATLDALTVGAKFKIIIDPITLDIKNHTLTAKEIKK